MVIFKDRQSAGKILAKKLKLYQNLKDALVLGIPRGGVVVAAEIAKNLKLPLDIVVTRKIGFPEQEELALGAVNGDGEVVWEEDLLKKLEVEKKELQEIIKKEWSEIKRREDLYRSGKDNLDLKNKTIILVDDGIATGATVLSSINYLKNYHVKKIILAVPIASYESFKKLSSLVNETVVLSFPEEFKAVGQFYHHFETITDEEVVKLLT